MKTLNYIFAAFMLIMVNTAFAGDKYTEAMLKNIEAVYKAQTIEELQSSVNAFERIASAEANKWEPQYYAAFGYVMMANKEKDGLRKDTYLDQALVAVEKAKTIAPNESEIITLEGFVYMIKVSINPAARGPQYAGLAMQTYNKALAINPENPRALSLLAQMQYGTAQFFGSSTKEACATLDNGLQKFETYKSDNVLAPTWGKPMAEGLKTQCK